MGMKRSALFHHHRSSGAVFREHYGWELPASYSKPDEEIAHVRASVGLADVSYRIKFETPVDSQGSSWRLGAGRYLVIGDPPLEAPAKGVEITSVYANLLLAGPHARATLAKLGSLNLSEESLPNRSCAQASMAHVHSIVLREDLGPVPAYHLLVTRDYAESVWEAVAHAGEEFTLRPFGLDALQALRG